MRALAEFAMRSRVHAIGLALVSSFVPLISPALVALVTLRKGVAEGLLVAAWALLVIIAMAFASVETLPAVFGSISVLAAVVGAANVLRNTVNWSYALFGLLAIAITGGLIYASLFQQNSEAFVAQLAQQQREIAQRLGDDQPTTWLTAEAMNGFIALAIGVDALLGLLIGRWWQALLYNPGGFQQEFHQLRLGVTQSIALISLVALALTLGNPFWAGLMALPLFLITMAIVHNIAKQTGQGIVWVILFYILLISMNPAILIIIVLIGASDCWINYRLKFSQKFKSGQ